MCPPRPFIANTKIVVGLATLESRGIGLVRILYVFVFRISLDNWRKMSRRVCYFMIFYQPPHEFGRQHGTPLAPVVA